jgi:predicted metal-dependent hydrolase
MKNSEKVDVEGIGAVLLERSRRARRVIITVRPGKGVRVAVPTRASMESAMKFVRAKREWIKKHLKKTREYEKQKKNFNDFFLSVDKKQARKTIVNRLRQLAGRYGFSFKQVSIRSQRTRWGSCSGKGNISLNIKLVALPAELSDYVILHELVHTRIHNHSPGFWKELDKYVGNGKAKAGRLKEYGMGIL